MRTAIIAALMSVVFFVQVVSVEAASKTWTSTSTGGATAAWSIDSNWTPAGEPNAIGDEAVFGTPTGTRTIELDGQYTVGSIVFQSDANFTQSIRNFNLSPSSDLLTFDAPDAGPATVTVLGTGSSNNRLQANMYLQDHLTLNVANVGPLPSPPASGTLAFTGNVTGPGGVTKTGDGVVTVAFNAGDTGQIKAWEGPTIVNGGRWRTSVAGTNGMLTSSFTVDGGQLVMISNNASYTFGPGSLNLNGFGPTTGHWAQFPGAIRPDTNLVTTITNDIVLQSDSSIALFGNSSVLNLPGMISGSGRLFIDINGGQPENQNGNVVLTGVNSYGGGTTVMQAGLRVSGESATLGLGDVLVDGVTDRGSNKLATGRLEIEAGVLNAIADYATVTLTGDDGVGGTPVGGILTLGADISDVVGGLVLGGVAQTLEGTYGSSASGADFQFDEYFAGTGVLFLDLPGQPGDHNTDGIVDAADYVAWRKIPEMFGGDPDGYDAFVAHFGEGGGGGAAGVPEPGALVLIAVAATGMLATRRKLHGR